MTPVPIFSEAKFMPVSTKQQVYRAWLRFLKGGLVKSLFTKLLYQHLTQHCSFIAHFDLHGFYNVYFADPDGTLKFLRQFDPEGSLRSVEYGDTHWIDSLEYGDINAAMCEAVRPYLAKLRQGALERAKARDLFLADRLYEKHGLTPRDR